MNLKSKISTSHTWCILHVRD